MTYPKRLLFLALALLFAVSADAQRRLTFRVAEFGLVAEDMTARNPNYEKMDPDGARYAIIKVTSDNPDDDLKAYKFDFGYLESFVEPHDDALWVYVRQNAKKVSIRREGYTSINQYSLGLTIQKGLTYRMLLSAQMPKVEHRWVQFQVTPPNAGAVVKVKREDSDGEYNLWGQVDDKGSKAQRLETGVAYLYEVSAPYYDKVDGRILLTNAETTLVEKVTLHPNFGYLEVADEHGISGAEVYVNDRPIGKVPCKERLDAGENLRLIIVKDLYKTYSTNITIRKGETTKIAPQLESDFAETTITAPDSAEIVIDGVSRGRGTWTGALKAGTYSVESRFDNRYRPGSRQITVKSGVAETFRLEAPKPILSNISVSSTPLGGTILLDGKDVGQTPKEIRNLIIGPHTLRVSLEGYRTEEKTVEVVEGTTSEVEIHFSDSARFTINCEPQASLELNNEEIGQTPYSFEGRTEKYNLRLTRRGYRSYSQETLLRASSPDTTFHLRRQLQRRNCAYVQGSFQVGSLMGFGANVGAYIYNVNVEAYATFGLGSTTCYLNYADDNKAPTEESVKARIFGGRVGYGITVASRLRITPQVGIGGLTVKSDNITGNALCATVGCRVDFAVAPFFGINLTPEGQFALSKKDVYKQLSSVSSKAKGWGTGGGVRLGFYFCF